MSPIQKASEIYNQFNTQFDIIGESVTKENALFHVDGIIEALKEVDIIGHVDSRHFDYWNDVKLELEKI